MEKTWQEVVVKEDSGCVIQFKERQTVLGYGMVKSGTTTMHVGSRVILMIQLNLTETLITVSQNRV